MVSYLTRLWRTSDKLWEVSIPMGRIVVGFYRVGDIKAFPPVIGKYTLYNVHFADITNTLSAKCNESAPPAGPFLSYFSREPRLALWPRETHLWCYTTLHRHVQTATYALRQHRKRGRKTWIYLARWYRLLVRQRPRSLLALGVKRNTTLNCSFIADFCYRAMRKRLS